MEIEVKVIFDDGREVKEEFKGEDSELLIANVWQFLEKELGGDIDVTANTF